MIIPLVFGLLITEIKINSQEVDSALITSTMGLRAMDQFDPIALRQGIEELYRLDLFHQIEVDTQIIADAVKVVISVVEFPRLKDEPKFIGNRKVKVKDLRKEVGLKEGEVLSDRKIFNGRVKIRDFYKKKGFYLTSVRDSLQRLEGNRASLYYIIEEAGRAKIRAVEIEGNDHFSDETIEKRMKNREKTWYRKAWFDGKKFEEDLESILEFYRENGFIDAQVTDYDLRWEEGFVVVTITVKEGPRYHLGKVAFAGNEKIPTETLIKAFKVKEGDVYNMKRLEQAVGDIYGLYYDEGYIYLKMSPEEDVEGDTINVTYHIEEGQPAHIHQVIIKGNESTNEIVIRRMIHTIPGSIFRRSEVIRSQREIFNLGFFEDIKIDSRTINDSGDIDLIYEVKEKMVGTIGAGITYAAQEGIAGYIELTQPNLFGRAQSVHIKLEKGGRRQNVEFGFTEPWFFDTPISAGFDVYHSTHIWDYYDKKDKGGDVRLAFPLPLDYTKGFTTLKIEETDITNISSYYRPSYGYDLREETWPKQTFALTFSGVRDSRDYIFNPSSGSYLSLTVENGARFLGFDVDYLKEIVEYHIYIPLFWKFIAFGRTRFGHVSSGDKVPVYELFFPGGIGEDGVRGYDDRSLGPWTENYPTGAKLVNIYNLELKLKASNMVSLLAFLDLGNGWSSLEDYNPATLKKGVGVGVRVEIPMLGLLGLDLGYGLDEYGPGRKGGFQPHFQFGRSF